VEFWYITIWDGFEETDHHFIDISTNPDDVITYCLNTFYGKDSLYETFREMEKDENILLCKGEKEGVYDIYCNNHFPDISIERKEVVKIGKVDKLSFVNVGWKKEKDEE